MPLIRTLNTDHPLFLYNTWCNHPSAIKMMIAGQEETGNRRRHGIHVISSKPHSNYIFDSTPYAMWKWYYNFYDIPSRLYKSRRETLASCCFFDCIELRDVTGRL